MIPLTLLIAVSGLSLIACGGGGIGSEGVTFTTSVNGRIPLDGLTSEQATQLCNEVNSANTARLEPTSCAYVDHGSALLATNAYLRDNPTTTNAGLQAACSQSLTALEAGGCLFAASCDAATIASNSPACMATVADIVNCINENDALARERLAAAPTCDAVTTSSLSAYLAPGGPFDTYNTVSMSASCGALASCSGISTLSTAPAPGS